MSVATAPELVFSLPDPEREFERVRLVADLYKRGAPPEFRLRRGTWELRLARPAADRIEYQLELVRAGGKRELVRDPTNPRTAPGPFGAKSVLELPGYEPPVWLEDEEAEPGKVVPLAMRSQRLHATVRGLLWSSPEAEPRRPYPLLVVHDGPEYAEYSLLVRLLDSATAERDLPPLRAALLQPVARDEHYSASARYASALARELLPALARRAPSPDERGARVGMGASLGALAMLHAHRVHPASFGALFLQSGSFFRQRSDRQESGFGRFGRITRFVGRVLNAERWPDRIPVVMTCGTAEENLSNNRAVHDALARQGYPSDLVEHPDAHNWVSWRDVLDPHLVTLLQRVWG